MPRIFYGRAMSRVCCTCQHVKRAWIDRRLASSEPASQLAQDYELNPSSLRIGASIA